MVSRRDVLKGAGALGAVGLCSAVATPQDTSKDTGAARLPPTNELLAQLENHETTIASKQMVIGLDIHRGTLTSLVRKADPLRLNYLGNLRNTPARRSPTLSWTGDVALTTWDLERDWRTDDTAPNVPFHMSGEWRSESTAISNDIRRVRADGNSAEVEYRGTSLTDGGLKSVALRSTFKFDDEGALIWECSIRNITSNVLEVGEVGIPFCVNNDYTEFANIDPKQVLTEASLDSYSARTIIQQSMIHEQKVLAHHFISGHSSYSLVQRPLGDAPFLLFHPIDDTALECIYPETAQKEARSSPDVLALRSRATKDLRGWSHNQWVNGHTSIMLSLGEERKFRFRFTFIDSYEQIRGELVRADNVGIRIVPAMVVQEDQPIRVELETASSIHAIEPRSDNVSISRTDLPGKTHLVLKFRGRGMKTLRVAYGDRRWTNLHFYCVEDFSQLLKARAKFIVARELYLNENDPFHRYHMFLPFDHRKGNIILESDEVWEVGGSDEPGFSTPLFLAEKNVYYPEPHEIEALEEYVSDCLFKYIQDPETYTVRASLYWVERKPSSPWSEWSKARSEATWRTYNYVHPANIYHALYRIGKTYGLVKRRDPDTYLRMSYRTCLKWFETGPWKTVGLMEGSNVLNILRDLKSEGWESEHDQLLTAIQNCERVFAAQPYPYSSELLIDQTAHEQVYFFTKYFGDREKNAKTVQVLKALRGGNQPVWFQYGNDKRRTICAWYSASLNGLALMRSFEETGDQDALARGFGGVASVMSNVTAEGMGFNYFNYAPGIFDHEPPITWEGGCGLWGFLQAAKSVVVRDPSFGVVGYGCDVEESSSGVKIKPRDGVRKRIFILEPKLAIEIDAGEIEMCSLNRNGTEIRLSITDSTGQAKQVGFRAAGLRPGTYRVGDEQKRVGSDGVLACHTPFHRDLVIRAIA